MKTKKLKIVIPFLLLIPICVVLLGAGCEKDKNLWEISPESKSAVIQKEVNGIEFKFCLLNEMGEPATTFKEGENFTFRFSIKNLNDDTITVTTEFISDNFFRVYQLTSNSLIDMGKPWTGVWCKYSLTSQEFKMGSSIEKQLNCPWVLTDYNAPDYPICMDESKNYLSQGEYSTSFNLNFHYRIGDKENIIDNAIFKINFEIQ